MNLAVNLIALITNLVRVIIKPFEYFISCSLSLGFGEDCIFHLRGATEVFDKFLVLNPVSLCFLLAQLAPLLIPVLVAVGLISSFLGRFFKKVGRKTFANFFSIIKVLSLWCVLVLAILFFYLLFFIRM